MIDIRQTQEYARYMKSLGWTVDRIEDTNYFVRKIPLLGSILKVQRPEEIRMDTINELCRKYGVFQTIIEPKNKNQVLSIKNYGFKLAKSTYLPSKTLQLDLSLSMNRLIDSMKKDARRIIKKSNTAWGSNDTMGEKGFIKEYSTPEEIKIFREGWKNSVKLSRYVPSAEQLIKLKKSFPCLRRQAQSKSLFLASHNISGSIIGGVIFTTSSHERSNYITYYWQAFTNSEGRSLLSQYSLLYQGILWAKKSGYKIFDFEGIYDPRFPNKSWLGFTHFKRSFGGYEVSYPGCYTRFKLPIRLTK